jgi:hypothetical protein
MRNSWIDAGQLRSSLYWSWIICSLPLLIAVLLPLVAPASWIGQIAPRCLWKVRFGRACPGCGLTSAFLHIARAEWREAVESNRAGIPLYAGFAVNSLVWVRSLLLALLLR